MTVEGLLARQTATRAKVLAKVRQVVALHWQNLGSWNDADVARFVDAVTPLVLAGQVQTAAITDVYLASVMTTLTGETVAPLGVAAADLATLRGVDPVEVYRRPFVEVWTGLKKGQQFADALGVGADRLLRLVDDDLSLAHRSQSSRAYEAHGVQRYRRVLRPYRGGGTCGLCIAASDQVYKSQDLLPIHSRCRCETLPIVGSEDPGRTFNDQDIPNLYAQAAAQAESLSGADLKKVRVQVQQHGELGPVLTEAGAGFTGPSDLAA